jgi:hypothetical protein
MQNLEKVSLQVKAHLDRIKKSEVIKDFIQRNEFKNKRTQQLDKECVEYLFGEIEKLAKALILCNANQTMRQAAERKFLDDYHNQLTDFESTIVENASKGIIKRFDERRKK